jgi:serine/threonine protein kinase
MDDSTPTPTAFIAPSLEELAPLFPAYDIEAFIAQGGMGAVYKARQRSLDRSVAIKILPREFGDDAQFRASFEAEAKAMARLNHPNLISVYDFGDIDGMLFIVMEFVQGKALFYSAHKKIIDPKVALPLVSTISRGLAHAHNGGIIHRDIKPANILLTTDATPKIGDFGLARPVDIDDSDGVVFGTPGYTAPEIYHRQPVDQRSDIFSVGALLYELLTGKLPAPESTSMTTGFDPRIDAIISKATQADPTRRYSKVDELADDIDSLLPKLSGPKFTTASPVATPQPVLASQKKSSALPVFITLALLIGGGAAAYFFLNQKEPATPVVETPDSQPEVQESKSYPKKPEEPNRVRPAKKPGPAKEAMAKKPEPEPEPTPEEPSETPLQSFTRLQEDLKDGNFDELPIGTIKKEKSAFFLHSTPMSADDAHSFAEASGATLAVAQSGEELAFLRDSFPSEKAFWIGASDAGLEGKWYWIDGSPVATSLWASGAPDDQSTTSREGQDFAALTPEGLQDFARPDKNRPLLEWKLSGLNPGTISAQLERTAASMAAKRSPIFPTATFEFKGSRYLLYQHWYGHQQASAVATRGGGHLAVLSSQEEANFLAGYLDTVLKPEEGCWFGGTRNEASRQIWQTPTGEIFSFHKWLPDEPNDVEEEENSLEYRHSAEGGSRGFKDASNRSPNRYLLIEWSHPSLRNMPKNSVTNLDDDDLLKALEEIRDKIRDRHGRDYRKFRRKYDEVVQDFLDNTITAINNEDDLSAPARAVLVNEVKKFKEKNELPESLPGGAPGKLKDKLKEARSDAKILRENYEIDFKKARQDYLDELLDAAKAAIKNGATQKAETFILENKVTSDDNKRFDQILDNKKVPLPVAAAGGDANDGEK